MHQQFHQFLRGAFVVKYMKLVNELKTLLVIKVCWGTLRHSRLLIIPSVSLGNHTTTANITINVIATIARTLDCESVKLLPRECQPR